MLAATGAAGQSEEPGGIAPPTEFSGFVPCNFTAEQEGAVTETVVGSVDDGDLVLRRTRGQVWRLPDVQSEDPRFTGTYSTDLDLDTYYTPGADVEAAPTLSAGRLRLENEDGAWQGEYASGSWPDGPSDDAASGILLRGEGAYEGFTALWTERYSEELCGWEFEGVVFEGEAPPAPTTE
jgi:hypothetical protein